MMKLIDSLVEQCCFIGKKVPLWTQGAGGNISVKVGDALLIKASGLRLDAVSAETGVARVSLSDAKGKLSALDVHGADAEEGYAAALAPLPGSPRASMETGMHVWLPVRWVLHFHSLAALLLADRWSREKDRLAAWLAGPSARGLRVAVLPCARPGLLLADQLRHAPASDAYVLKNHGVVLAADSETPGDTLAAWAHLESAFCAEFGFADLRRLLGLTSFEAKSAPAPLRLYFPDTAVFLDRLLPLLERTGEREGEPLYRLAGAAWKTSRDVCELWQATELLFQAAPDLTQLPSALADSLATLPTEVFRRQGSTS